MIGCTIIGIKTTSGTFLGSNSDNPWNTRTRLIVAKRDGEYKFIGTELICQDNSVPWANMITRGLNEKGLAFTFAYVQPLDGNYETALGMSFKEFSWELMGKCSDIYEVEEFIKNTDRAFHGNFLFADRLGNLELIEISTKKLVFVKDLNVVVRCNHFLSKEMQLLTDIDYAHSTNSYTRYQSAMHIIESSEKNGKETIKKVLTSHVFRQEEEDSWGHSSCNHGRLFGTVSSEIINPIEKVFSYNFGWPCGEKKTYPEQLFQEKSWGFFRDYFVENLNPGILFSIRD